MTGSISSTVPIVWSTLIKDPITTLRNWVRVVKPGGHLVVLVPDEDLYEQGVWPSTFNSDHKHTFTICKTQSWSPVSVNVTGLIASVADAAAPLRIELLHQTFVTNQPRMDQTLNQVSECAIEIVMQKRVQPIRRSESSYTVLER